MTIKGFVVGPPIDCKHGWNMKNKALFYWLLGMCLSGRIGILWLGPPPTSFTCVRKPRLRSQATPLGFDVLNWDTLLGNYHLHLSISLWIAQSSKRRLALLQTPWGAFSRLLPAWKWCCQLGGIEVRLDYCRFGSPINKSLCLLANQKSLAKLSRTCLGNHHHTFLKQSHSTVVAEYPRPMCSMIAGFLWDWSSVFLKEQQPQWNGSPPNQPPKSHTWQSPFENATTNSSGIDDEVFKEPPKHVQSRSLGRFVSHLWSTQLSESLPWRVFKKYRFQKEGHINVLECHARRSLLLQVASAATRGFSRLNGFTGCRGQM